MSQSKRAVVVEVGRGATLTTRQDVESIIIEKATRYPSFRAEILSDPRRTLEREFGILLGKPVALPDDFEIRVVEECPNLAYLVLPPAEGERVADRCRPRDQELDPQGGLAFYCTTMGCKPGMSC